MGAHRSAPNSEVRDGVPEEEERLQLSLFKHFQQTPCDIPNDSSQREGARGKEDMFLVMV